MKQILIIILFSVVYKSCEKRVPIDLEQQDPKVVVDALYDNTKSFKVGLSRSAMIDNAAGIKPIENATISLYENGTFKTVLDEVGNGVYEITDTLEEGETYKLDISTEIGNVVATNTMPAIVPVIAVDSVVETQIVDNVFGSTLDALMVYFTFQDMPGSQYYVIKVIREGAEMNLGYGDLANMYYYEHNYRPETSGIGEANSVEQYTYLRFEDDLFDQELKTYKFGLVTDRYMVQEYLDMGYIVKLKLYSISEEYYTYLQSLEAYWNAEGDFFAESINLFSNVEGGLGIFAGASMSEIEVDMTEIISR
jgi:hypothetical protein